MNCQLSNPETCGMHGYKKTALLRLDYTDDKIIEDLWCKPFFICSIEKKNDQF